VSDILNQFHEENLPPSTVDIMRAVRAGQRRRRIRTGLAALAAVVALVIAGATAPIWLSSRPGPPPPAEHTCGSPVPSRPAQPTWELLDPLTSDVDATGVAGFRLKTSITLTTFQYAQLASDAGDREVTVVLFACGAEPRRFDTDGTPIAFDPSAGEPADPIGGSAAYWLSQEEVFLPGPAQALAWQWTAGAWVIAFASAPEKDPSTVDTAELRGIATRVAPELRLGAGTPVTSPFSLPVPAGMFPAITVTRFAADNGRNFPLSFGIGFDTVGSAEPTDPLLNTYLPTISVSANFFANANDRPTDASEYPEDLGHPAYQTVIDESGVPVNALLIYDYSGLGAQIETAGVPGTAAEKLSAAADLFRSMTVYPGAAEDVSAWGPPVG
jgi:hypothetical protein